MEGISACSHAEDRIDPIFELRNLVGLAVEFDI